MAFIIMCIIGQLVVKFNNLISLEENVNLAYSNVEKELQARLELIQDLVETVKQYTKHEETVYNGIADERVALNFKPSI